MSWLWVLRICFSQFFQDTSYMYTWNTHFGTCRVELIKPSCQAKTAAQKLFFIWLDVPLNLKDRVAQSVTCLATDACLTADPGVASSIPARYHTFVEIDHEIISTVILLLRLIYSRGFVVSYKRKYVHKLLVNRLLKPAQEKVWLSELTVPQWP